ncbi:MAG TPA: Rieske 2Fe-2S domain-containing protein [Blastocatellia bacterium]|jgi:Ferredoxin subunits of nitrite reductase and ring-hydroxylating dioxygenases|nr:Rieske 2Fe-2S domain-containing protein [Blastocatellia bacterium]
MSEFIKVAKISDIPVGRSAVIEMDGRTIALFNVNGEFFALDNTCMHRGGPLGEGFVDQNNLTVQCPWHGWVYSLATGASPMDSMAKVEKFDVKVEGEEVMIALD